MKVFITGGTGFIGTHLVKLLQDGGHDLRLLTRKSSDSFYVDSKENVTIITGDLSNIDDWKNDLRIFQPDVAIHLAWEGIPDYGPKQSIKNLIYGLDLYSLLADIGCKCIISTGSCWEYGVQNGILHENMTTISHNAFTIAKNTLYNMGKEIADENNMHFIWTRLFYVYGPGQKETSLIPYIINCVQKGTKPEVKTPSTRNDFIYVEDAARAISEIMGKRPRSGVYNIGSGYSTSIHDIINIIYGEFNLKRDSMNIEKGNPIDFCADISKIKDDVGWQPKIHIKEGVKKMIGYNINISQETIIE